MCCLACLPRPVGCQRWPLRL
uniref:Uncharacterized protein n=1 Tax=Arundo donax TaxID=35708 RepID=A0A0A8ZYR0_ARUDO